MQLTTGDFNPCWRLQIIINDCLVELDKFIANGDQFDFIFGDLTEVPLAGEPQDKEWQFFETILDKSLRVLKPNGCFLTHVKSFFVRY